MVKKQKQAKIKRKQVKKPIRKSFYTQEIASITTEVRNGAFELLDSFKIEVFDCFVNEKFNYRGGRVLDKRGDVAKHIKQVTIKKELLNKITKLYDMFYKLTER